MKKLLAFLATVFAAGLLVPVAQAGHPQRRVVGYNQCGDAVYATYRVVSYQRCGTPNYGWVRDRATTSCTRPGRCNYHGHARARTVCRSSSSRLRVGYTAPRITFRSSYVRRSPSRSYRSSSRSVRRCR